MKNKNPLLSFILLLLIALMCLGITWGVIVGAIKIITLCFGLRFSLAHSTGLWGILMTLWILFYPRKRSSKKKTRDLERCKNCINSRPIVSENGIHAACCLRAGDAFECMIGQQDRFVEMRQTNDHSGSH